MLSWPHKSGPREAGQKSRCKNWDAIQPLGPAPQIGHCRIDRRCTVLATPLTTLPGATGHSSGIGLGKSCRRLVQNRVLSSTISSPRQDCLRFPRNSRTRVLVMNMKRTARMMGARVIRTATIEHKDICAYFRQPLIKRERPRKGLANTRSSASWVAAPWVWSSRREIR
jgi:hypothetical protein